MLSENWLENKTIVIIGGTTGLGISAAKAFVSQGARIVVVGRNLDSCDEAQKQLGNRVAVALQGDADAGALSDLAGDLRRSLVLDGDAIDLDFGLGGLGVDLDRALGSEEARSATATARRRYPDAVGDERSDQGHDQRNPGTDHPAGHRRQSTNGLSPRLQQHGSRTQLERRRCQRR